MHNRLLKRVQHAVVNKIQVEMQLVHEPIGDHQPVRYYCQLDTKELGVFFYFYQIFSNFFERMHYVCGSVSSRRVAVRVAERILS